MKLAIYIDESGESGIVKIRTDDSPGASPFFVLGALACNPTAAIRARQVISEFKDEIGKTSWKHATDLNHVEKVYLSRLLGKLPVRFFGLISNKATLQEYKDKIDFDPQSFYNKCAQYLLENICEYFGRLGFEEDDISYFFEDRNHDFDRMYRYLAKVKENPIYNESKALSILNPFAISRMKKGEDELLEIADFVAHAIYQCANKSRSNFFIPETRYFTEISSRFAGDSSGRILGTGLKCIHSLGQLDLDDDVARLLNLARAKPASVRNG